jgi:hypothetical protein
MTKDTTTPTVHILRITNRYGDTAVSYAPGDTLPTGTQVVDGVDHLSTAEVKALFDEMITKNRMLAFTVPVDAPVAGGTQGEVIRDFDATAPQIVMVPQIVGG